MYMFRSNLSLKWLSYFVKIEINLTTSPINIITMCVCDRRTRSVV